MLFIPFHGAAIDVQRFGVEEEWMVAIRSSLSSLDRLGSKISNRSTTYIVLSLIIGLAFALNLWLVAADNRPPSWDYADYLARSLEFYNAVKGGSLNQFVLVYDEPFRPPFVSLMALPFYALLGTSYRSAMLVNLIYIAVLALSTYKLGARVQSPNLGLVAAAIVTTLPGIFTYARVFGEDFPTTALVATTAYAVTASNGFSKRNISILAGVLFGFGMLVKWSYFVFVFPLVLAEVVQYGKNTRIFNFVLGVVVAALVTSTWYIEAIGVGLVHQLLYYAYGPGGALYSPSANVFDIASLRYYPAATYNYLIGPFYSIALVAAAILWIVGLSLGRISTQDLPSRKAKQETGGRKRRVHTEWSLAFALAFAPVVFTLIQQKQPRYLLAVVPLALPLFLWVGWRIHLRWGPVLMIAIAVTGVSATAVGALQPAIGVRLGLYEPGTVTQGGSNFLGDVDYSPPKPFDWKVEQIIGVIGSLNPEAKVGMLTSHWVFNQATFHYYALRMGYGSLIFLDFSDPDLVNDGRIVNPYSFLYYFDFVIMKTGDIGWSGTNSAWLVLQRLDNASDPFYRSFVNISTILDLPDGSQASIFMKTTSTSATVTTASSYNPAGNPEMQSGLTDICPRAVSEQIINDDYIWSSGLCIRITN